MQADRANLERVVRAPRRFPRGAVMERSRQMGVIGVDDAITVAALILPKLFKSASNYDEYKSNANQIVDAFQRDFVTAGEQVGFNIQNVALELAHRCKQNGINLTAEELIEDARPSAASIGSNIGSNVSSFFTALGGGSIAPLIMAGGGALLLFTLLRK